MSPWLALLVAGSVAAFGHGGGEDCEGETQYYQDEQKQQSFLLNYFALATTFSPLHGPIPGEPGHGGFGLELAGIPPLSCERRLVLDSSKAEDTNKAPVAPRLRVGFTLPALGRWVLYGGAGYVPPITVFETRNVILSVEAGVGTQWDSGLSLGARYHATMAKTVAEIATPFHEGDPTYEDLYLGSTFGADLLGGWALERWTPYLAAGITDVSTFFYVGDDGVVSNNAEPYLGPAVSAGVQTGLGDHLDLAGEFYTAPGVIYTGRLRAGLRW